MALVYSPETLCLHSAGGYTHCTVGLGLEKCLNHPNQGLCNIFRALVNF